MYRVLKRSSLHSYSKGGRCHYHVVCAGGGIMGCTSAYHLAQSIPPQEICIIERDFTYSRASTSLSLGSVRQQFSQSSNILLSMKSTNFLKNDLQRALAIDGSNELPSIQFVEGGYLFLASESGEKVLRENYETQIRNGASVKLLTPSELKARYPWINTTDIKLASIGTDNEGWFDSWLLLSLFKAKLISLGIKFMQGEVVGFNVNRHKINHVQVKTKDGDQQELKCDYVINTAGPFAAKIAEMAGIGSSDHESSIMRIPLPVRPRKRCMYTFHCPRGPKDNVLLVDWSGVGMRRENQEGMFVSLITPKEEEDHEVEDLDVDYQQFDEKIWPLLAHRVPAFESLKVKGGWAGFYEYNTFDQNAIIGPHPVLGNLIFANGFSGHGIQQSAAVGLAVSEIVTCGRSVSVDVNDFSFQRIIDGKKYMEKNVI